jgi:hypothetical protein
MGEHMMRCPRLPVISIEIERPPGISQVAFFETVTEPYRVENPTLRRYSYVES